MEEITTAMKMWQDVWPTVQPAISSLFGTLITNLFLRGNTSKVEFEKIKQAKFSEVADKLLESGHISHLEYYKCRNFNKIAKKADELYRQKDLSTESSQSTTEHFTIDWFVRFFEAAGNISDEQMQELWARVLTGEIKHPGSFSLRTLDTLRNMSKKEAEIFQEIASYAINVNGAYYICVDKKLKQKYGYSKKLLAMYDCGIVENELACHYDLDSLKPELFMFCRTLVCFSHNESKESYSLDVKRFTNTGNELISFVQPNETYLLDFFKDMKQKYPRLNLTVHRVLKDNGDTFTYQQNPIL